jgi:hypothetical protein
MLCKNATVLPNCYLIPWLGPQFTYKTDMFVLPDPMETQSSPVPMVEEVLVMFVKPRLMSMPLVFGLFHGALMATPYMSMLS